MLNADSLDIMRQDLVGSEAMVWPVAVVHDASFGIMLVFLTRKTASHVSGITPGQGVRVRVAGPGSSFRKLANGYPRFWNRLQTYDPQRSADLVHKSSEKVRLRVLWDARQNRLCVERRVLRRKSTSMHTGAGIVILEAGASCERLGREYAVAYLWLRRVPQMA